MSKLNWYIFTFLVFVEGKENEKGFYDYRVLEFGCYGKDRTEALFNLFALHTTLEEIREKLEEDKVFCSNHNPRRVEMFRFTALLKWKKAK